MMDTGKLLLMPQSIPTATNTQTMMAGQTNQYCVTKRRTLRAINPNIKAMNRSDIFSSRLDIAARFDLNQKNQALYYSFWHTLSHSPTPPLLTLSKSKKQRQ